jgi:hypothetical protein
MGEENVAIVRAVFDSGGAESKEAMLAALASTKATVYAVFTFRDSKVIRYREFYDETAARASIA